MYPQCSRSWPLFGAEDTLCGLHGPSERVLLSELRGALIAGAAFPAEYAAAYRAGGAP
ncbi:hypothetical protein [Streptomyces sp. CA2R101]|uniref:hypothetical protein n=1 Tax=Streptomyces sp. CA2R101 TaxID=3120152 RepID=UPI0030099713